MQPKRWVKPGGIMSILLVLVVTIGLFSFGITSEVPVGSVAGVVTMEGGDTGLPGADVILYRISQDGYEGESNWRAETQDDGSFSIPSLPAGRYAASVFGKAHRLELESIQVNEGEKVEIDLVAKRQPDYLGLNLGSRIFRPDEEITLRADGSTKANDLNIVVYQVQESSFTANQDLSDFLYAVATNRSRIDPKKLATLKVMRTADSKLVTKDIEGVFVHEEKLSGMGYGTYLVEASVGPQRDFAWLTVTDIALVTKTEPKKGEAFVVEIDSGEPLVGVEVDITRDRKQVRLGETNADGLIQFDPMAGGERLTLVSAKRGDARAHTWFYRPYVSGTQLTAHFVTDRPVYRPGDLVQYKAVLRKGEPSAYTIPAGMTAEVKVSNPNGDVIAEATTTADEWGSLAGEFRMNESDLQGTYTIEVKSEGQTEYAYVPLASYRTPQFEIDVKPSKSEVVRGDNLIFVIECTSYTGEPIVGAKVLADLYSGYDYWGSGFDSDYEEYESDYGLEYDRQFELTTDENGRAEVSINTARVGGSKEYADFADTDFKLSASVSDEAGRFFSSEGRATAKRGEFDVRSDFDRYVANPGQPIQLEIEVSDTALNTEAQVIFGRDRYGEKGSTFIEESKHRVRVSGGKGLVSLNPKNQGSYRAEVKLTDSRGNEVETESYVWIAGGTEYQGSGGLAISLDQRDYEPGGTAQAVIRSDRANSAVWVTVEGEGLLSSEVVRLAGSEAVYEIPVTDQFSPNFTVSVTQVAGKEFYQTQRGARVGLKNRELVVSITPDRNEMRPGETVNMLVSTADQSGKPVQADVALRVVDEGIYQIRADREDPLATFYPRRWTEVSTNYSFPEIYLDGEDKGGEQVTIRKDFADTAFWSASVRTGTDGTVIVPVKVPDNLTTWRATGSAFSLDTRVGKGVSSVVSRKELMLRMSLPQFLTQDDEQEIAFTVTNATDSSMAVAYELTATGVELKGESRGTVQVPARSREVVTRTIRALGAGDGVIRMVGRGGTFEDGLEQSVEIQPRVELRRIYQAGSISGTTSMVAALEVDSKALSGGVTLSLAPNMFSAMEPILDELIDYPYGCVEQTMSRFVPAVLVREYWRTSNQPRPDMDAKIDEAISRGFSRLRELQNSDGGFGWFGYDEGDARMQALVLDGLYRIRAAGVSGTQPIIDRALPASELMLKETKLDGETWRRESLAELADAYSLYATSEGVKRVLGMELKDLEAGSLIHLAMAAHRVAERGGADTEKYGGQAAELWKKARSMATITESGMSWGDARVDSIGVEAALVFNLPDADKIMRQLLKTRNTRGWGDTWRTSQALKAGVSYADAVGVKPAVGVVAVQVNGQGFQTLDWSSGSSRGEELIIPIKDLRSGGNEVKITFAGEGQIEYALELEQGIYAQVSQPQATPPSFRLKREYLPMVTTRLEDGSLRRLTGKRPSEEFKSGDVFRVRLTITVDNPLEYVAIEDPIPSNCRIVEAESPEYGYDWTNWWSNSTFGDSKAAFFIHRLAQGDHVIEYAVRAEATGVASALPTRAYPMYMRDVLATSAQNKAEVKR